MLVHPHGFLAGGGLIQPDDLANLAAWYRADLGVTGDPVTNWADQSGSSRDLDTVRNTPAVLSAGGPNSQDAIEFDGTEGLKDASGFTLTFPVHVFLMVRVSAYVQEDVLLHLTTIASSGKPAILLSSTKIRISGYDGTVKYLVLTDSPSAGTWALVEAIWNSGTELKGSVDDGTPQTTAVGTLTVADGAVVGSRGDLAGVEDADCDVAEVVIYDNGIKTGGDRSDLMAYFTDRYGIP